MTAAGRAGGNLCESGLSGPTRRGGRGWRRVACPRGPARRRRAAGGIGPSAAPATIAGARGPPGSGPPFAPFSHLRGPGLRGCARGSPPASPTPLCPSPPLPPIPPGTVTAPDAASGPRAAVLAPEADRGPGRWPLARVPRRCRVPAARPRAARAPGKGHRFLW
ncbi:collagen alpha-1(I) chain-like [Panthera uncia]|uniref:collagen alpha-1(I) chain-like n=1 Tax=Panthera uncia TaxID=29064 RepID=UPI0020FFDC37|nr:collagen alpha-1(I) chain-like [Panthera uncia]